MARTISATEARVHFGEVLRKVAKERETYIVERDGKPEAVVLSVVEYRKLMKQEPDDDWWTAAQRSQEAFRSFWEQHPAFVITEAIREGSEERAKQIEDAVLGR
jgi:prevent-host-death family protein